MEIKELYDKMENESAEIRRRAVIDFAKLSSEHKVSLLLKALGDEDWRVRKEAVRVASQSPNDSLLVSSLIDSLGEEENIGLKNAAIEVLSNIGDGVISDIIAVLGSPNAEVRKAAIDIIGAIKTNQTVDLLVAALRDEDLNVRIAAVEQLGRQKNSNVKEVLLQCLREDITMLQSAALQALRNLNISVSFEELVRLFPHQVLREELLLALGRCGSLEAVEIIGKHIIDEPAACIAMESLHGCSEKIAERVNAVLKNMDEEHRFALANRALSENKDVARAAIQCILWSERAEYMPNIVSLARNSLFYPMLVNGLSSWKNSAIMTLCSMLDTETEHRLASVIGLISRLADDENGPSLAPVITPLLSSPHPAVSTSASSFVARFGDETVVDSLVLLLSTDEPRIINAAGVALSEIGKRYREAVRDALVDASFEGYSGVSLCRVMEIVGDHRDLKKLEFLAASEDSALRRSALRAFASVGRGSVIEKIEKFLQHKDLGTRIAAADALAIIGKEASSAIVRAINVAEGPLLGALIRALGKVGHCEAEKILVTMCRKSPDIALSAVEAASSLQINLGSVREFLLGHSDIEVVKSSIELFKNSLTAKEIARLIAHESWDVRLKTVQESRACINNDEVLNALKARLPIEEDDLVRESLLIVTGEEGDQI